MDSENPQKPPIVFSCSGASDTGGLADAAARSLARSGMARMYCLAGVGSRVEQIVTDMAEAERLVSVDGCGNECSRRMLEAAGFTPALHLRITDLGMAKWKTPHSVERIQEITDELQRRLRALTEPPPAAPEDDATGV